jgi:adenosine deaminase
MSLADLIRSMPKVELHVHLEGSIRPETVLELARRHGVTLPADSVEGLRRWYRFTDFAHFVDVYLTVSSCVRTPEDIELIAREFLAGQAEQNVRYSEVTYTAVTHWLQKGLSFDEQLAALNRARAWGERALGVRMGIVIDIPRNLPASYGPMIADWAIAGMGDGVVAFGLGGPEAGHPPEKFADAFARARAAGLPSVPHAGETDGPRSIWGALQTLGAVRIGHGVRCLEDPRLVTELRDRRIPLEVCPTSNVCLGVAPDIGRHPLPRLLAEGLYVTINSDDPPMFNTTLTDEYLAAARAFGLDAAAVRGLVLGAVRATLLPADERDRLEREFAEEFTRLGAGA